MERKFVYFIENENQEWYSFVFRGPHTTSDNPNHRCGCATCSGVPKWTKDPLRAMQFESNNDAVEFNVAMGWDDCFVTEHEFVSPPAQ